MYESSDKLPRSYICLNSRSDPYGRFSANTESVEADNTLGSDVIDINDKLSSESTDSIEESSVYLSSSNYDQYSASNVEGGKRQRIDKMGAKKKFSFLSDQIDILTEKLVSSGHPSDSSVDNRVSLADISILLEELSSLSSSSEIFGELPAKYSQLRQITEFMQQVRKLNSKIVDLIHRVYIWNDEFDISKYGSKVLTSLESDSILSRFESKYSNLDLERARASENSKFVLSDDTRSVSVAISDLFFECRSSPIKLDGEANLQTLLTDVDKWNSDAGVLLGGSNVSNEKKKKLRLAKPHCKLMTLVHAGLRLPVILLERQTILGILRLYKSFIIAHHEISDFLYLSAVFQNVTTAILTSQIASSSTQYMASDSQNFPVVADFNDEEYAESRLDLDDMRYKIGHLKSEFSFPLPGLGDMERIVQSGEKYREEVLSLVDSTVLITTK